MYKMRIILKSGSSIEQVFNTYREGQMLIWEVEHAGHEIARWGIIKNETNLH